MFKTELIPRFPPSRSRGDVRSSDGEVVPLRQDPGSSTDPSDLGETDEAFGNGGDRAAVAPERAGELP